MLIWLFIVLLVMGGIAYWLGWGRASSWEESTGWQVLDSTFKERIREANKRYLDHQEAPRILWHGHSTLSLEWKGTRLVFDPLLGGRVSIAPRLFSGLEVSVETIYDRVVLTHAHMDHFDPVSIARLRHGGIILPRGSERFLDGQSSAAPLLYAEEHKPLTVGELQVIALPACHGGWRYPWQRGLSAQSYLIRCGKHSMYVAGDTAWGEHFQWIGQQYAPDFAVIPIGAYSPAFFLQKRHLNPEEAVEAALRLGVRYVMPCHFGTYRLSLEAFEEPLLRFAKAVEKTALNVFFLNDDLQEASKEQL